MIDHILPDLQMDNTPVKNVRQHKPLGLVMEKEGKWKEHVEEMTTRAMRRVGILRGLRWRLNRRTIEKLYVTYIQPIFEYGGITWSNCTDEESEQVERVQLAAARIACGLKKGTSHLEIYCETKWEKLEDRRRQQCLTRLHSGEMQTCAPNNSCKRYEQK